jgi:hypothetical protein
MRGRGQFEKGSSIGAKALFCFSASFGAAESRALERNKNVSAAKQAMDEKARA